MELHGIHKHAATSSMSKRTATNEVYRGLVEAMSIPAELHERPDGTKYASFGGVVPIHCCTPEQVSEYARRTHHYCDVFTDQLLAPLGELAYVRLDDNTAEKVFINRVKRIVVVSADGALAQWRAAPSFESANRYVAGTPLVNKDGALVSVLTARRGNHYAVSTIEGDGGYFDTPNSWQTVETPEGHLVYGNMTFPTRDELRAYVAALPPAEVGRDAPPTPVLQHHAAGTGARLALVAGNGRQMAHVILQGLITSGVEYL
ncbi:poxin-like isoform X2 [Pectinophora gossypiella]|uniref:poxin-like isoform X2 n=1 Tax=Pectinophora gossypiella TaxID=13191 RepID=UPI00214F4583|nr:poxin-like isoform X2 [Pectinophora gossypiella]